MRRPDPPANQRTNGRDAHRTDNDASSSAVPLRRVVHAVVEERSGDNQPCPDRAPNDRTLPCSSAGSKQDRIPIGPPQPDRQRGINLALDWTALADVRGRSFREEGCQEMSTPFISASDLHAYWLPRCTSRRVLRLRVRLSGEKETPQNASSAKLHSTTRAAGILFHFVQATGAIT